MRAGRSASVAVAALAGLGVAGVALGAERPAARLTVPAGERTSPRVTPASGTRRTTFVLSFTLREQPGHRGVLATDYGVQVSAAGCRPPQPAAIRSGTLGARVRVRLPAPGHGWCSGRHSVAVFLERGPYCPPPVAGRPPTPCPMFATQEVPVGVARFTVG